MNFAPSLRDIPPPLVSVQRVQGSLGCFPNRLNGCYPLQLDDSTILKVGRKVHMGEMEAIIMDKNQTSVHVAKVLNAYMIEEIGSILMGKIHGCQVFESWLKLPRVLKQFIAQELQSHIQQWQKIEWSFFGTVI